MNLTDAEFIASKKILCHYEHSPKHFILKDQKGFIYSGKSYCEKHYYDEMKRAEERKTIIKNNFQNKRISIQEEEEKTLPENKPLTVMRKKEPENILVNISFKIKINHLFEKDSNMEFIQKAISDLKDAVGKENIQIEYKIEE